MKIINSVIVLLVAVLTIFLIGCGQKKSDFGQPVTETTTTLVGAILAAPEQFVKKTVRVEGRITDECPAGGWFFLKDETGTIYVNLHPSYFAIPPAVGRWAVTQGTVRKEGPQIEIIGKGVQLK